MLQHLVHLLLMTKSRCGANNHQQSGREHVSQVVFGVHDVNTSLSEFYQLVMVMSSRAHRVQSTTLTLFVLCIDIALIVWYCHQRATEQAWSQLACMDPRGRGGRLAQQQLCGTNLVPFCRSKGRSCIDIGSVMTLPLAEHIRS